MIYYTADTHFGHANVIEMCERPYPDVDAMNEAMIAAWNERVHGNDTVYIIGDMFFRCADPESILRRLKGKKRLIVGNHDGSWMGKVDLSRYFLSVDNFFEISDGAHGLTLCHYPMLTWKHAKRTYMIHGHIHADTSADFWPLIQCRDHVSGADGLLWQPGACAEKVRFTPPFPQFFFKKVHFSGGKSLTDRQSLFFICQPCMTAA